MGQKTNPILFRLGILKNEWKFKFISKNLEEFSLYNFQSLEIKKYLNQFLNEIGLLLHDYKIFYTTKSLHLYISYFFTSKMILNIKKLKIKKALNKQKQNKSRIRVFFKSKLQVCKKYEKFLQTNKFRHQIVIKKNNFLEQILEGLTLFLSKKLDIVIIFQYVRKGLSLNFNKLTDLDKKIVKNKFLSLRKYAKDPLYKDMLNLLILCVRLKNSANILAEFICYRLTKIKKHSQFFYLLKYVLVSLQKTKISKIKGIKIKIKGRFNGRPRTASKFITIGETPVQTLTTQIDYAESICYTSNGTFGIKVWLAAK